MNDVWSSACVRLPRQMEHLEDIPLPMEEAAFLSLTPGACNTANSHGDSESVPSLLGQMVKLNHILVGINEVNEMTVAGRTDMTILEDLVKVYSQRLDDWRDTLPDYMRDSPTNLARYASQGLGRVFVAVYLGYYHFGQLLFYQFLDQTGRQMQGLRCWSMRNFICR